MITILNLVITTIVGIGSLSNDAKKESKEIHQNWLTLHGLNYILTFLTRLPHQFRTQSTRGT